MIKPTVAFVTGVVLLQYQPALPHVLLLSLLLPLAVVVWRFRSTPLILLPATLVLGFLWAAVLAHLSLNPKLAKELEGTDLLVSGVIHSLPEVTARRTRFQFEIDRLVQSGEPFASPGRVLLSWYQDAPDLSVGERWQLLVRLKRPHGMSNPGGSDYERVLYLKGIRATGYVRAGNENGRLEESGRGYLFDRLREKIGKEVDLAIGSSQALGIVRALVIGDRTLISRADWETFRKTGTNHLIAISGLHIGIISGLFLYLGSWLWRRSARLCTLIPAPQVGAVSALIAGISYAGLAGFAIPCVRALVMLAVVLGAVLFHRAIQPSRSLCSALLLVVLFDPVAVVSPGFWLSFGAVAAIMMGITGRISLQRQVVLNLFKIQWAVTLGLAPILLILGFDVPLISPLVNLIVVPLFSLLLVPLSLISVVALFLWQPLGTVMLTVAAWLLGQVQIMLSVMANYSGHVSVTGDPPVWMLLGALLTVLLLLLPAGIPGRWLGLFPVFSLLLFRPPHPSFGEVWMTMLDVGQGLAIVLETSGHVLLYDAGPRFPSGFDTGEAVVIPYLRSRGVTHIDRIIISNGDMDHRGGLSAVMKTISIGDLLSGEPERIVSGKPFQCKAGMTWQWDGVVFEILHPNVPGQWQGNNASCVLSVTTKGGNLLLTGDIEAEAEAALMARNREKLQALVVSVPHHGSASSSGTDFIAATGARYGLISAGYRNRYRFPREEVQARWQAGQTVLLNTADTGGISLQLQADGGIKGPISYRHTAQRYWMDLAM